MSPRPLDNNAHQFTFMCRRRLCTENNNVRYWTVTEHISFSRPDRGGREGCGGVVAAQSICFPAHSNRKVLPWQAPDHALTASHGTYSTLSYVTLPVVTLGRHTKPITATVSSPFVWQQRCVVTDRGFESNWKMENETFRSELPACGRSISHAC